MPYPEVHILVDQESAKHHHIRCKYYKLLVSGRKFTLFQVVEFHNMLKALICLLLVQYIFTIDPCGQALPRTSRIAGALVNRAAPSISKYPSTSSGMLNFKSVSKCHASSLDTMRD